MPPVLPTCRYSLSVLWLLAGCAAPSQPAARVPQEPASTRAVVLITPAPSDAVAVAEVAAPAPGAGFVVGQRFVGTYRCLQGVTELSFEITAAYEPHGVEAIFSFDHVPSGAAGAYRMIGLFDPASRRALFTPLAWLEQPDGYVMVGMDGTLSADARRFSGRIAFEGCGDFSVEIGDDGARAGTPAAPRRE